MTKKRSKQDTPRAEAEPVGDAVQLAGDEEWWIALDTYKAMRQERDDLRAKMARAEAALVDCVSLIESLGAENSEAWRAAKPIINALAEQGE